MNDLDRSIAPTISNFKNLNIPQPREIKLDNGIPMVVLDNGSQEVNRLSIIYNGGVCETSLPTIATLTANLIREGTEFHSGAEIAETMEYNGAWIKSNVHAHHLSIVAYSLNHRMKKIMPLLTETIVAPSFPPKEMETVREKLARAAELDREKVEFHSALANRKQLFGENHPLANSDTPNSIREITINDLKAYHLKVFTPKGCKIFLSGHITPAMEDIVNENLGNINPTENNGCQLNIIPFNPSQEHLKVINRPNALQSAIRLSIPTIDRNHNDYIDLRYTVMALGGYFGSRLMANIREDKGYTYGISSSLLGYKEGGIINIATQCDNQYVKPLIEEVKKEIERLKTDDFSIDELNRLKHYAMTQLASILDSPFSIMDYYENMLLSSTPENYFADQIKALNNLTSQRIAQLAETYLQLDNLYTSIAGNVENEK